MKDDLPDVETLCLVIGAKPNVDGGLGRSADVFNFDVAPVDPNKQAMPPVAQGELKDAELLRPQRVKPECAGPNFNATKTALNHVNRPGHTSEVDPFTGSSGLRNFQVRAQGPVEESDRVSALAASQDPGVDKRAQR